MDLCKICLPITNWKSQNTEQLSSTITKFMSIGINKLVRKPKRCKHVYSLKNQANV